MAGNVWNVNEMMTEKKRWPREAALEVARELCNRLKPVCSRLIVAGSLRRRKASVGDVEILYVPLFETRRANLFEDQQYSLADEEIEKMVKEGRLAKRESVIGGTTWGTRNKLAAHLSGMPVDLFRADDENWWNYLVCRTGPAESNMQIASEAKAKGWKWNPYGAGFTNRATGQVVAMESESAVFEFVGMTPREPWKR